KDYIQRTDMLEDTNTNILRISEDFPPELLAFFDSSVEYLKINGERKKTEIHLKFKNKEEIILNRFKELNKYLSSGTIKGINTFVYAMEMFKSGGYILIDEIENHFNQEIVSVLIRFFQDKTINPNGAVLIFSTHYSELLDEFERNDNIYIVRNNNGISAQKLSEILKRNDIKKSEAFQSGYLGGTTINYNPYISLKKMLVRQAKGE
ncbi:MAG: ATP-binding protein, partial [Eubacterium sp.]|nr:ATP-binding protein [Eubacterium sp.]